MLPTVQTGEIRDPGATRDPDAALLELIASLDAGRAAAGPTLVPGAAADGFAALTEGQRQLWFLDRLAPGSSAYNVCCGQRLTGRLDASAVRRAVTDVVNRHEALRTNLGADRFGRPVGTVRPPVGKVPVEFVDLAAGDADTGDLAGGLGRRLAECAERAVTAPFALATDLLVRGTLVRLGPTEHVLILVFHHAVIDAWSLRIVLRELGVLYSAHARGVEPALEPVGFQYPDYAAWCQDRPPETDPTGPALEFWARTLAGAPELVTVPADHARPVRGGRPGRSVDFAVPAQTAGALHEAARRCRTSAFTVALTVFAALLADRSGTDEVMVGVPSAGRFLPELASVVGYFVNLLPLRIDLGGGPSGRAAVTRVGQVVAAALDHDVVPFDRVVRHVGARRVPGHSPLVQVLFQLLDGRGLDTVPPDHWAGLRASEWTSPIGTDTRFDLELSVRDLGAGGVDGSMTYDTNLYRPTTTAGFLETYLAALGAFPDHLDRPIADLPAAVQRQEAAR